MEKLDELYYKLEAFFKANPKYVWLVIAIIFIPLGIGSIFGKKWAVDPANSNQKFWYSLLGHKIFGIIVGIGFILAGVGGLFMFFQTK